MKLVTVDQMRRIEAASDAQGHTYAVMMERAGSAVARVIQTRLDIRGQRILVLAGPGNNGGDGLVAARHLHDAGAKVGVFVLKPRDDADAHTAALCERGIDIKVWSDDGLHDWLSSGAVIVDALLARARRDRLAAISRPCLIAVKQAVSARRSAAPDLIDPAWPTSLRFTHSSTARQTDAAPLRMLPLIVAVDGRQA